MMLTGGPRGKTGLYIVRPFNKSAFNATVTKIILYVKQIYIHTYIFPLANIPGDSGSGPTLRLSCQEKDEWFHCSMIN